MAPQKTSPPQLNKREREIYEIVVAMSEASVSDVMAKMSQPPSYSAVRATLTVLMQRGFLKHRSEGKRYLYRPAMRLAKARKVELTRVLSTFFGGSATEAMAALLDVSAEGITDEQYDELVQLIQQAKADRKER